MNFELFTSRPFIHIQECRSKLMMNFRQAESAQVESESNISPFIFSASELGESEKNFIPDFSLLLIHEYEIHSSASSLKKERKKSWSP